MQLEQFIRNKGLCPVVLNEDLQFSAGADTPLICSGFYQSGFGAFVLAEQDRLAKCLAISHDKLPSQSQDSEQLRFVGFERNNEQTKRVDGNRSFGVW